MAPCHPVMCIGPASETCYLCGSPGAVTGDLGSSGLAWGQEPVYGASTPGSADGRVLQGFWGRHQDVPRVSLPSLPRHPRALTGPRISSALLHFQALV